MKKLEWILALQDRLSAPAGRAEKSVEQLRKALRGMDAAERTAVLTVTYLTEALGRQERQTHTASGGFRDFVNVLHDGLGILGMVRNAGMAVVGWMESIGRAAYAGVGHVREFASWVLQVGGERESAITGMATVLQDRNAAAATFRDSLRIAQLTPFETADVVRDRTALVLAGFTTAESRVLYAAAADIRTAMNDPMRGEILMRAFTRIRGEGGVNGRILEELTAAGVGRSQIFAQLAAREGRNFGATQQRELAAWATARLHAYDANQTLNLIIDTIEQRVTHAGIGEFARAQSSTINGILSNLASLPHDILSAMDIEAIPGVRSFKATMQDFLDLFAEGNAVGARFRHAVGDIIDALFGGLFTGSHESRVQGMSRFVDQLSTGMESFARVLRIAVPAIRDFVEGFATATLGEISSLIEGIANNVEGAGGATRNWGLIGENVGHAFGNALRWVERLAERVGPVVDEILDGLNRPDAFEHIGSIIGRALATGMKNAFLDTLESGGNAILNVLSFGQWNSDSANDAQNANLGAGGPHLSLQAATRLAQAHVRDVHVHQHITVGPGTTPAMGEGAAQIRQSTTSGIRDALRRVDMSGG